MPGILEKAIWTEADFDHMGWHDASVYGIAFLSESFELVVDIDYILKWVDPVAPSPNLSFWVSPATLAFQGVKEIDSRIALSFPFIEQPTIQDIRRPAGDALSNAGGSRDRWTIELHQGSISFRADGFHQFFRRMPVHMDTQEIGLEQRGGLSFGRELSGGAV